MEVENDITPKGSFKILRMSLRINYWEMKSEVEYSSRY
jgi:hypothetical protein